MQEPKHCNDPAVGEMGFNPLWCRNGQSRPPQTPQMQGKKGNVPRQAALEAEISAEPKPEQITGVTLGILFQLVF